MFFFLNNTATTQIYTLSLHDALPILVRQRGNPAIMGEFSAPIVGFGGGRKDFDDQVRVEQRVSVRVFHFGFSTQDRKSTRLNSSHVSISYAVFCLKKKI